MQSDWVKAKEFLMSDGIVVLPTDTLYGIVGRAESRKVVERIYETKGRSDNKPFIVLITSYEDLEIFGIKLDRERAKILKKFWPGKVSVILPCKLAKYNYLHLNLQSIAFRMIGKKNKNLFNLIKKVGPLVAPSANPEGKKPAESIKEAKAYFGNQVDFYLSGGILKSEPSTLIRIKNGKIEILRQGKVKISLGVVF